MPALNYSKPETGVIWKSKPFLYLLIIILGLRISSYFTLFPDSVAMTQLVKTGLRLVLTALSLVLILFIREKQAGWKFQYKNVSPLALYIAYLLLGIISLLWTSSVSYTLLQLSMVIEALVFACFFYKLVFLYNQLSNGHARFSKIFAWATLWIHLAFIIGLWIDPDTYYRETHGGEVARLGGFIINPNELGMLAVLGAVMTYEELLGSGHKLSNFIILILAVAVLLLTQSRSSLGAFLLVSGLALLRSGNIKLIVSIGIAAIFVLPFVIQSIVVKQGDLEEVMSMTGRLPFWQDLIADGFTKEPLLGYGFMRISYNDYFDSVHAYAAKMTHNTFIQVLLNLGLVGAFIVALQMIATTYALIIETDKKLKALAIGMLIPLVINSMTEFGIFGESNYGIQFYQLVILFFVIDGNSSKIEKYAPASH